MAGVKNKVRLNDGTVGVIKTISNGNCLLLTTKGDLRWCSQEDIKEIL